MEAKFERKLQTFWKLNMSLVKKRNQYQQQVTILNEIKHCEQNIKQYEKLKINWKRHKPRLNYYLSSHDLRKLCKS